MGFIFPFKAKVINLEAINENVVLLKTEKPSRFNFKRGQVVDMSVDQPGMELSVASFTIANSPNDEYLEFIIKVYQRKDGVTHAISELETNDYVQISYAWDSYSYKGGGTFIAAGAGITAFWPIFKSMDLSGVDVTQEHRLIYADKTKKDVLYHKQLQNIFRDKLSVILSRSHTKTLSFGRIDKNYLLEIVKNTEQYFYVCGPKNFEVEVKTHLLTIGVSQNNIQTGYKV